MRLSIMPTCRSASVVHRHTAGKSCGLTRPGAPGPRVGLGKVHRVAASQPEVAEPAAEEVMRTPFFGVKSEEQFMATFKSLIAAGKLPANLEPVWMDFYSNYKTAVLGSGVEGHDERLIAEVQAAIADRVLVEFIQPFTFSSFHTRITEPYNYFEFGQRYAKLLIDFENSFLGHFDRWTLVQQQLEAGENVVLLANHQTEGDPAVFAHMLRSSHKMLAEQVIYVAGDRVVDDAMCKPFSMGRNLFCVHSKKHMGDDPEKKAAKQKTNMKTLVEMGRQLNEGGKLLWIAPSGGRDRPNQDGVWCPASFDPSAVELMRNLASRAKQPTHLYPMAMFSYPIMPPPPKLEKDLGERRLTNFSGVGIILDEELDVDAILDGIEDKEQRIATLSDACFSKVQAMYALIDSAIKDPESAKKNPIFSRPWKAASN